jgi:hypothetical protein
MRPCGTRRLSGERSAGGRHNGTAHRDVADDSLVLIATVFTTGDAVITETGITGTCCGHPAHDEQPVDSTAKAIYCGVACQFATSHGVVLVHRRIVWRWWPFQNFDLAAIVDVLGDLGEIAHIEPLRTDRGLIEVIGLALSNAVARRGHC